MSVAIQQALSSAASVFGTARSHAATRAADTPATSTTTTSTTAGTSSSTITSSDFLTLLVTEMKNQDPTQPTDPTQYVQQLVGVNSLEQLIDINKGVSTLGTTTATSSTTTPAPTR